MQFCIRPRQGGKTHEAIAAAARNGGYIVCADRERARYIARRAQEMGYPIHFPLTFHEFTKREYHGRGIGEFIIEDVESLLQWFAGPVPIALVTATGEAV